MQVTIAAIGKMKASAEQDILNQYIKQLPWSVTIKEIDIKKNLSGDQLKSAEAEKLLQACTSAHRLIALDERGKSLGSEALAKQIGDWQQDGCSHLGVIIGGADGLDVSVRQKADLILSFGAMTWPHMMVRAMLSEQLYRTHTILTGHPYHRR